MKKIFPILNCRHLGEGRGLVRRRKATFIKALRACRTPAFAGVVMFIFVTTAHADAPTMSSSQPVTISAVKSLEWDRNAKTYTARQDVIATQGAANIHSDLLVAHYDDVGGKSDIKTLDADGHVTITSVPYTAYGDHAVYDVKTGNAVLTGKNLKIVSLDSILTARDKIIFNGTENKMTAVGDPRAVKGDNTLTADTMSAYFTKDEAGKMTANKITAKGHVIITTPTETAMGDDGVYDVPTQKAVLTGKVSLLQDKNWLEGTRADVDMVTGISRLSGAGNAATEGRVTGTFYPQQKTEAQKKPQDQAPEKRENQSLQSQSPGNQDQGTQTQVIQ